MPGPGRIRRTAAVAAVTGLTAAATLAATAGAGPTDPQLRFADGTYDGTLTFTGSAVFPEDIFAIGAVDGTFSVEVVGGDTSGSFQTLGTGSSVVGGDVSAVGDFAASFSGAIAGRAEAPQLLASTGGISGEVTVDGFTVPIDIMFGPADFTPIVLEVQSATCNQVVGDWTQEVGARLAEIGASADLFGRWVATRSGDAPLGPPEIINQLIQAAEQIAASAKTGMLDAAGLHALAEAAEKFSSSLAKGTDCGLVKEAGKFNTVITSIVIDLLEFAVTQPDGFTSIQIGDLVWIGIRVGAVGEGALNQPLSDKLLGNFEQILSDRLKAAISAKNTDEIGNIMAAALAAGFSDLAKKAGNAL